MQDSSIGQIRQLLGDAERSDPADATPFHQLAAFAVGGELLAALQDTGTFPDRGRAFRLFHGYCLLRAGHADTAFAIFRHLFDEGWRNPFLIDNYTVAHAELGRFDEGYDLLANHPDILRQMPAMTKRLAAFAYASGRLDEANRAAEQIRGWCTPRLLQQVEIGNRPMEQAILADPEARPQLLGDRHDCYAEPAAQLRSWLSYAKENAEAKDSYCNSVAFLNTLFSREIAAMRLTRPIEAIVNFGSLFGSLENRLAGEHPDCTVIGYDRSTVATRKNQDLFRADNLHFVTSDFAAALSPLIAGRAAVLCHGRTGTLMFPEELARLYDTCRSLGIRHILAIEDFNFNLARARWPDFRQTNQKTTLMGGHMMVHDYEAYLGAAGYRVEHVSRRVYPFPLGHSINSEAMVIEIRHASLSPHTRV